MINEVPDQIQNEVSIKEVWVLVVGFFMLFSAVSWVLLSIRP